MLVLGVPVIKCFLCFGVGDLGVDEEAVVGEVEGGEAGLPIGRLFRVGFDGSGGQ